MNEQLRITTTTPILSYRSGIRIEARYVLLILVVVASLNCRSARETGVRITLTDYEMLHNIEEELPLPPDSIAARYQRFDSTAFRVLYHDKLEAMTALIDSLDRPLPESLRIDTLSIDHYIGNFGYAGMRKTTIYISSSYFIIFDDASVLRSVIFHEFGHLEYAGLPAGRKSDLDTIWNYLQRTSLLYLVHDGEYSGNARFGGHPHDSPGEMFASAFNLLHNRPGEMEAKLEYVEPVHLPILHKLFDIVLR